LAKVKTSPSVSFGQALGATSLPDGGIFADETFTIAFVGTYRPRLSLNTMKMVFVFSKAHLKANSTITQKKSRFCTCSFCLFKTNSFYFHIIENIYYTVIVNVGSVQFLFGKFGYTEMVGFYSQIIKHIHRVVAVYVTAESVYRC